jgi:hypothetical protein
MSLRHLSRLGVISLLFALPLAVVLFTRFAFCDDALIGIRVALNLKSAGAFCFNPTERILTFANPLWLGLTSLVLAFGDHYGFCLKVLAGGAALLGMLLTTMDAGVRGPTTSLEWGRFRKGLLVMVVMPAVSLFVTGVANGLEGALLVFLFSVFTAVLSSEDRAPPDSKRGWRTAPWFVASLIFLTHFSAVIMVAPLLLARLLDRPSWAKIRPAMIGMIPGAIWLGFAWLYYGSVFPHSLHGELNYLQPYKESLREAAVGALRFAQKEPFVCAFVGCAVVKVLFTLGTRRRRDAADWLGLGLIGSLLFPLVSGATQWSTPNPSALIWVAALVFVYDRDLSDRLLAAMVVVLLVFFQMPLWLRSASSLRMAKAPETPGTGDSTLAGRSEVGLTPRLPSPAPWRVHPVTWGPARRIILSSQPGLAGLRGGPAAYVMDRFALADPFWSRISLVNHAEIEGTRHEPPQNVDASRFVYPLSTAGFRDAVAIELRLKEQPPGWVEPIMSAGFAEDGDLYMISHLGHRAIRFLQYKSKMNVLVATRIIRDVDFTRSHRLVVKYGLSSGTITLANRSLLIWDGALIKEMPVGYKIRYFEPWEIAPGWNTIKFAQCVSTFSGTLIKVDPADDNDVNRFIPPPDSPFVGKMVTLRVRAHPLGTAGLPLLVTGREGSGDFLFLRMIDGHHAAFGHDHWGTDLNLGQPVSFDFDQDHEIEILSGPLLRDRLPEGFDHNLTQIRLDGRIAFQTWQGFYPFTNTEAYVLENPILGTACGADFQGEVLAVTTDVPGRGVGLGGGIRGRWGYLSLLASLGDAPPGLGQSLVETGRPGKGDAIYIVRDDATHVHFGFDHWGIGGFIGPSVAVDPSIPHRIIVEMASLLPPAARGGERGHTVKVTLDGEVALFGESECHEADANEVFIAENRLGVSTTGRGFAGFILDVKRL